MPITFKLAPLAEIIAEVRWSPDSASTVEPQGQQRALDLSAFLLNTQNSDELFMNFGGKVHAAGFTRAERVTPAGFPSINGQVIWRYRRGESGSPEVLQIGNGIFSANCVPPYSSWNDFSATVRDGIRVLIEARSSLGQTTSFSSVSLRYIDAFGDQLVAGRSYQSFIADVLGFEVKIPDGLQKLVADGSEPKAGIVLNIDLANDLAMGINIGEGIVQNNPAVVMDTTVRATKPVVAEFETVMATLDNAHEVIQESFLAITAQIHSLMNPVEKGA